MRDPSPPCFRFALTLTMTVAVPASAAVVPVATSAQLLAAVAGAAPGDVITLAPGTYDVAQNIFVRNAGTAAAPIVMRAARLGDAAIRFTRGAGGGFVEGFNVGVPHWIFENLDIEGVCATHSQCEHAFHIVAQADLTVVRDCRLHEFNAAIKGNGGTVDGVRFFPDDVLLEGNHIFNSTVRSTSNPVAAIDVVGGRRWVVRSNRIEDYAKGAGNLISYHGFLKGGSSDGLIERNLVFCERRHSGGIRVGLSLGGGGGGTAQVCQDGICTPQHRRGTVRNNIVLNCPDVGIDLNAAADSQVHHNNVYDTFGIGLRHSTSSADLRNNLLSGSISTRDGSLASTGSNLEGITPAIFQAWFRDPANADFTLVDGGSLVDLGEVIPSPHQVSSDYCDHRRDGMPDIGAVEYGVAPPCDTTEAGGAGSGIFSDGFESGNLSAWSSAVP